MKIRTLQIKLDAQTFKAFKKMKKQWKAKNWNDFIDKLIIGEKYE